MKPLKKIKPVIFKKKIKRNIKEKIDRFKDQVFRREFISKNIKFQVTIERDSKNKKVVYIEKLTVARNTKITPSQLENVLSQVVEFAKKNKIDNIKTHTWIFIKHPGIQDKLGFSPANKKEHSLFLKKLKDNAVDTVLDLSPVNQAQYYLTGNYYYLKYFSKSNPKEIKVIGSSKLGDFPLFEKKI